jgi:hypothetical protein
VPNHEVCALAAQGLAWDRYSTPHSNVQMYMLEHDSSTFAMEVPLWAEQEELPALVELRKEGPMSGHIDALRLEGDHVWVWDFKPNAAKERYASTQILYYAIMLSLRSGLPLEHFRCGYFDNRDCFIFDPLRELEVRAKSQLAPFLTS